MKVKFSRHAKRQMNWRGISESEVRNAILEPEKIENSIKGRKNAFKHINKKWIKVTFQEKSDTILVVTAMDKNN